MITTRRSRIWIWATSGALVEDPRTAACQRGLLSLTHRQQRRLVGAEALAALAIRTESLTSLCLRANRGDAGARSWQAP